jgi:hypothetical protein
MTYDTLRRMTQRVEPRLASTWVWNTTYMSKGKRHTAQTSAGYVRTHAYDNMGRPHPPRLTWMLTIPFL